LSGQVQYIRREDAKYLRHYVLQKPRLKRHHVRSAWRAIYFTLLIPASPPPWFGEAKKSRQEQAKEKGNGGADVML